MNNQHSNDMPQRPPHSQKGDPADPDVERLKDDLRAKTDQVKELKDDVKELRDERRSKAAEMKELKEELRAQANEMKELKQEFEAMEEAKKKAEDSLKDPPKSKPATAGDIIGYWSVKASSYTSSMIDGFTIDESCRPSSKGYVMASFQGIMHRTVSIKFLYSYSSEVYDVVVGALSEDGRTMNGFYVKGGKECIGIQCLRY
jgi:hypothetical protein